MISEKDIMLMKEFREKLKEIKEKIEELRSIAKQFDDRELLDIHLTVYSKIQSYVVFAIRMLTAAETIIKLRKKHENEGRNP